MAPRLLPGHWLVRLRSAGVIALLAAACFVAARLSLLYAFPTTGESPVRLQAGLALAALLRWGSPLWPGIALGAGLAALSVGAPWPSALATAAGDLVAAYVGFYLLRRVGGVENKLERQADVLRLIVMAAVFSTLLSSSLETGGLLLTGSTLLSDLFPAWRARWMGNGLGILILTPLLLTWRLPLWLPTRSRLVRWEASLLALVLIILAPLTLSGAFAYPYLLFPFILWAALRFGPPGSSLANAGVAGVAALAAAHGTGPFVARTETESFLLLGIYLAVLSVTGLILAANVSERQRLNLDLQHAKEDLERRVVDRTAKLERSTRELSALYETSLELQAQTNLGQLLESIVRRASRLVGVPMGALYLLTPDGRMLEQVACLPPVDYRPRVAVGQGLTGSVALRGEPMAVENYAAWPDRVPGLDHIGDTTLGRILAVPLKLAGRVIGVLVVQDDKPGVFEESQVRLVTLLADQAAIAVENTRLYAEAQQRALTDELTGVLNRRGLVQAGKREFERALRFERPLAAILFDLDRFKMVNDAHGHAVGDEVLRALVARCSPHVRAFDLFGRYGGEEFVLLLPETDLSAAHGVGERLRQRVAESPFETAAGPISVTVSVGVAARHPHTADLAALLAGADRAMYKAKRDGRNRVSCEAAEGSKEAFSRLDPPPGGLYNASNETGKS